MVFHNHLDFCVDYRSINQVTKGDNYPVPSVANILDAISYGKIYGKFVLASGYWQVNPRQQDRHKTAFTTYIELFEFLTLPFALKTAPNTFQRILNTVFSQFLYQWLIIYVDDCVTWSNSYADVLEHYQVLLETATKVGIQFKPSKCVLFSTKLDILGHEISSEGRRPAA